MSAVRILIVDDHEIVREGIRNLIARSGRDWEICGEGRDGQEAVAMIQQLKPDVAILDITMPVMSGLEAARKISRSTTGCKLLIFTMHDSPRLGPETRDVGAHGYVLKTQAARDLIRAIDALLDGNTFYGTLDSGETKKDKTRREGGFLFCAAAFA